MRLILPVFFLIVSSLCMSLQAAPVSVDTSAFGSDGDADLGVGFTVSATTRLIQIQYWPRYPILRQVKTDSTLVD